MPKKIIIDADGKALTAEAVAAGVKFEFENGDSSVLLLSDLTPAMLARAAAHGISQKAGDSYAGSKDEPDPVAFAVSSVADVFSNILKGDWRAATTGTGGNRVSDFARAVAQVTGKELAEVVEALAEMTDEQKKPFKDHAGVKSALAAIKAAAAVERATKLAAKVADAPSLSLG